MPASTLRLMLAAGGVLSLLTGCNSDLTDSGSTTTQSAVGVWGGTDSVSGDSVTALVNSGGQAVFIRGDGVQFDGNITVSSNNIAASVTGYSDFAELFSDGSESGVGTISGTVTTGSALSGSLTFTTDNDTAVTGSWSLTYQTISDSSSSPAAVSASYQNAVNGDVLAISTSGAISGTNSSDNCTLSGSISTSDSTHNIYEIAYTYSNCTGTYQALNGVQLTGLATLNTGVSPAQLVLAVSGSNSSGKYGLVAAWNATG
jgi:hypothetical protein